MIAENRMTGRIHVMHLTDTLDMGGRERIVVDLANRMPKNEFETSICTTRRDGPLMSDVADHVGHICLHRTRMFQLDPVRRLVQYIREREVDVLHAHGTSILVARMAAMIESGPMIVWHDHFGTNDQQERSPVLFRLLTSRVAGVLAVSDSLADWSRNRLGFPDDRVWWLPNCVNFSRGNETVEQLPGKPGKRIVNVANLRPAKDHLTLIRAFNVVVQQSPDAHLLLIGAFSDSQCHANVVSEIDRLGLKSSVSLMGQRSDVPAVLRACDIGVLSSVSEGLPVSLLEYGAAGLAVASTDVGQCGRVLGSGRLGRLVSPGSPDALGHAIAELLVDDEARHRMASDFHQSVAQTYSVEAVVNQLAEIYTTLLARN